MDVEFVPPHQENGNKNDAVPNSPPEAENSTPTKVTLKQKRTRSRSRTPLKKVEETKTLQVTLTKMDADLNSKTSKEEAEQIGADNAGVNALNGDESKQENNAKEDGKTEEKETAKEEEPKTKEEEPETQTKDVNNAEDGRSDETSPEIPPVVEESPKKKEAPKIEKREKAKKRELNHSSETEPEPVEMDQLIVSDEPDPELQFDENSDLESGKESPVIQRCVTRRSQTRNIPTPKTPRSLDQESEKNSTSTDQENENDLPKTYVLEDTNDSTDTTNLSTKAEVGSDLTRMEYVARHHSNFTEDSSYINASRERSLSETLRCLSARRPIRPTEDYRRTVLRNNQEKSDLNMPYTSRNSVEQITTGIKRKNRSITPEEHKKFKMESPAINSLFYSPLSNLKNKFRSDIPSSTPKLLGYKDNRGTLYGDDSFGTVQNGDDEKKSWCSIM